MDSINSGERITLKRVRPNPLFQTWLEELHNDAKQKKSELENMLNVAVTSLSKYPLTLQTGAECAIINGFDKNLCFFLDKKLKKHNNTKRGKATLNHDNEINTEASTSASSISIPMEHSSSIHPSGHTPVARMDEAISPLQNIYRPPIKSGGYAILIALLKHSNNDKKSLDKQALIEFAQQYTDDSITISNESFNGPWSYMDLLIINGLVNVSKGKTVTYSLTDNGNLLANDLSKSLPDVSSNNELMKPISLNLDSLNEIGNSSLNASLSETSFNYSESDCIELKPNNFDIVLLIDKQENGLKKKNNPTLPSTLHHEYRSLKVGDYAWVAKDRIDGNKELILPFIVERKRMDDLAASIKDGRFHEQKFRLRRSGIQNIIYLVEHYNENKHLGLPLQSLMQALANTRMIDNFIVHITKSLSYSIRFLSMMTKRLECRYKKRHLKGGNAPPRDNILMTFQYFNKSSIKNKSLTVKETFIKMLLQLKGVSVEKAIAITKEYPTPRSLICTYSFLDEKAGEMLLANLKYGYYLRNVGQTVSRTIYQLFSKITI